MSIAFGKDLTVGSIPKTLANLAIPIFLAYVLFSGYSIINTIWIGNLLGGNALAAVAINIPIVMLLLGLCNSIGTAVSVLVAKNFGAKRNEVIQKVVNTSFSLNAVVMAVIIIGGVLGTDLLIELFDTPAEIRGIASSYLKLTFVSFIFISYQMLIMAILRSIGNTKIPLLITFVTTIINAVLDPILINGFSLIPRLGLNGAAIATIICSAVGTCYAFIYLKIKYGNSPLYPTRLILDKNSVGQIAKIGFPTFVQHAITFIGAAFVTTFVNGFGAQASAVFGTIGRIESFVIIPPVATFFAVSTMTAQSIGAKKSELIKDIFKWGLIVNMPPILLVSLLALLIPNIIMQIFVKDLEIIHLGVEYFHIVGIAYLFYIPFYVANGIIIGAGKAIVSMLIGFISFCLLRVPLAALLSRITFLGLNGVWIAVFFSLMTSAAITYIYYLSGRWKPREVKCMANLMGSFK